MTTSMKPLEQNNSNLKALKHEYNLINELGLAASNFNQLGKLRTRYQISSTSTKFYPIQSSSNICFKAFRRSSFHRKIITTTEANCK